MARNIGIAFELGGVHAPIAKKTQKDWARPGRRRLLSHPSYHNHILINCSYISTY